MIQKNKNIDLGHIEFKPANSRAPLGYKWGKDGATENKTVRLQLVLQPSVYRALKLTAKNEGVSVNEYVSQLLKAALPNYQ